MFNSRVFNQGTYNYTREQLAFAILQGTGSITARAVARFVASAQLYGQGGIGAWATRRQFGSWAAMGAGSISAIARILVWAVMVEEGTTNLFSSPQDLATYFFKNPNITITTDVEGVADKATVVATTVEYIKQEITADGGPLTYTVIAKKGTATAIDVCLYDYTAGAYIAQNYNVTLDTDYKAVSVSVTSTVSGHIIRPYIWFKQGDTIVLGQQIERKPYATSFIDGTRSPETLTIPGSVLNPQEGTVECRVYFPPGGRWSVAGQAPTIFWAGSNSTGVSANQIYADVVNQGTLRLVIYDSSSAYKLIQTTSAITSGWHYLAYKWDGTGPLAICVDGVNQSTITSGTGTGVCSSVERFTPGFNGYDNARQINSLIDDLRISSKARTDAEIQAVYQNRELLVWDEYTTYLLECNNNLNFPVNRAGNWIILHDLGITPDEINFSYVANVPSGHIITREYATSADGVGWSEWQDIPASGTIGCARYVKIKLVLSGTDLSNFWVDQYNLVYNTEFANPQLIYSGLTPGVYVCFTSYAGRAFFCAKCRPLVYDGNIVRPVGVDPPGTAPTLAVGVAGNLSGAYKGKVTFVNADNIESNPSPASDAVSVTNQKINWTIPTGPAGTAKRKLYRTKAGGNVYYEVAEINDNTTTSYEDNLVDSSLVELMEDDNNIPPVSSLVYSYKDYMFYVSADDESQVWYSKPARPEQVPNITGKQFFKQAMGPVRLLKAFHDALIVSGMGFTQAIFGTVFTSDITLDNTTTKFIDSVGALSHDAATVCVDPRKQRLLAMVLETGELAFIMPGLQEQTLQAYPASRDVAPIFRQAILRHKTAIAYYGGQLYVSLAWHKPGGVKPTVNNTVLCYDFVVGRWQGIINSKVSHIISTPRGLYLVSAEEGIVNKLSESQFLPLILDSNYQGNIFGINALTRISNLRLIVSNDSVTDNTKVKIKVDNNEYIVSVGSKNSWDVGFWEGGDYGYGRQDAVVSPRFPVYVPIGRMFGWRLEDSSENPLTVYAVVLECEPVYFM